MTAIPRKPLRPCSRSHLLPLSATYASGGIMIGSVPKDGNTMHMMRDTLCIRARMARRPGIILHILGVLLLSASASAAQEGGAAAAQPCAGDNGGITLPPGFCKAPPLPGRAKAGPRPAPTRPWRARFDVPRNAHGKCKHRGLSPLPFTRSKAQPRFLLRSLLNVFGNGDDSKTRRRSTGGSDGQSVWALRHEWEMFGSGVKNWNTIAGCPSDIGDASTPLRVVQLPFVPLSMTKDGTPLLRNHALV